MGASIATLLQSFQKSAAAPDGFLFQTVKNLKGGQGAAIFFFKNNMAHLG
jgi:hypothetical protein